MRALAIARRVLRQIGRDRRTFALVLGAPIVVLSMLYVVMGAGEPTPHIGAVEMPQAILSALRAQKAEVTEYSAAQAASALREGKLDAVMSLEPAPDQTPPFQLAIQLEGSDPSAVGAVMRTVMRTAMEMSRGQAPKPKVTWLHGSPEDTAFDHLGPVLLGLMVFFFVYLVSGVSFVRERTTGTLERMLATPVRQWEIVVGYALAFSIVAAVQSTLVSLYCVEVLGMPLAGPLVAMLLITALVALSALAIGMLLSAFARNEFQMIQFIPLVLVPQILFSGLVPLDSLPAWVRAISYLMPLRYAGHALRAVMQRGQGLGDVAVDALALCAFVVITLGLNVLALHGARKAR